MFKANLATRSNSHKFFTASLARSEGLPKFESCSNINLAESKTALLWSSIDNGFPLIKSIF